MIRAVFILDSNFIIQVQTVVRSILNFNKDCEFWFITDNINSSLFEGAFSFIKKFKCRYFFVDINKHFDLDLLPMPKTSLNSHISRITYARLYIPLLIPENVDKILYLDGDVIVRNSLQSLWDIDLEDHLIAGVRQIYNEKNDTKRLDIPEGFGYINAGVLLMNLKRLRALRFAHDVNNFIKAKKEKIIHHDQDVINAMLHKEIKYICPVYNAFNLAYHPLVYFFKTDYLNIWFPRGVNWSTYKTTMRNPIIVHFTSVPKPWQGYCFHPFANDYFQFTTRGNYAQLIVKNIVSHFLKRKFDFIKLYLRFKICN